jgi:hypothetical protein
MSKRDEQEVEGHKKRLRFRDPDGNDLELPEDRVLSVSWRDAGGEHEVEGHGIYRRLEQEAEVEGHAVRVRFRDEAGEEQEVEAHGIYRRLEEEPEVEGHRRHLR